MSHIRIYNIIKKNIKKAPFNFKRKRGIEYNYNRKLAMEYAQNYALDPNLSNYPLYKENDCTNFVCQALRAGGMNMMGGDYKKFSHWFCYTKNPSELRDASLTWRSAQYFRMFWGHKEGEGFSRAREFKRITVEEAILSFDQLYELLLIGDVIQYGDATDTPYHTQIIHEKGINIATGKNDIFVAQHSANKKHVSFNEYLRLLNKKKSKYVYIYHF